MKYRLTNIHEGKCLVNAIGEIQNKEEPTLDWVFNFGFDYNSSLQYIHILVDMVILEKNSPSPQDPIFQLSVIHTFDLSANTNLPNKVTDPVKDFEEYFIATLLGVSLGTIRGIAFVRSAGLLNRSIFMPVVSPLEIIKDLKQKSATIVSQHN